MLNLIAVGSANAAANLDWSMVVWNDGELENSYVLSNGITVTIRVTSGASGTFDFIDRDGHLIVTAPYIDGASGSQDFFGTKLDLGIFFNPDSGQGQSPVTIEVTFSETVTDVSFEISDIDYSPAGVVDGSPQQARLDEVILTSDVGNPTLSEIDRANPSFQISGNRATATRFREVNGGDQGSLLAEFPDGVQTITITYNEASGNLDPAGRGIGILASFTEVPVELMMFSVD